ncbi:MAG TPA: GNAT family N-acetyltransferase [Candidatus Cybelea sp.]|nr:GNAT family N-acetyltransferase [Candidatus Cybelea sp.]
MNARVERGSVDDVRSILRRRSFDDAGIRFALESAERGNAWVTRDAGECVGVAIARDGESDRYVGDLYVEPSYRGRGLGRELLGAALNESDDRATLVLLDSNDPAAMALALRRRLAPRESLSRFAGAVPKEEELAKMAAGDYRFGVETIDAAAHAFGLRGLDRQARGTVRDADHADFALRACGNAFFLNGEFVAYTYVWPDGRVGPIASASQNYIVQILAHALLTLSRRYGASWCSALVPGSNLRVARAAMRAGLRIAQTLTLAYDSSTLDLSAYVAGHALTL